MKPIKWLYISIITALLLALVFYYFTYTPEGLKYRILWKCPPEDRPQVERALAEKTVDELRAILISLG